MGHFSENMGIMGQVDYICWQKQNIKQIHFSQLSMGTYNHTDIFI